jgi:PHD/YefM family antitoxin component YafN of YafNO toxin-antitoxin module
VLSAIALSDWLRLGVAMKTKRISAYEAENNFKQVIGDVERSQRPVIVESASASVAIVPLRLLEVLETERSAAFAEWRAIAERVNLSDEEADLLVEEAIAEVRAGQPAHPEA